MRKKKKRVFAFYRYTEGGSMEPIWRRWRGKDGILWNGVWGWCSRKARRRMWFTMWKCFPEEEKRISVPGRKRKNMGNTAKRRLAAGGCEEKILRVPADSKGCGADRHAGGKIHECLEGGTCLPPESAGVVSVYSWKQVEQAFSSRWVYESVQQPVCGSASGVDGGIRSGNMEAAVSRNLVSSGSMGYEDGKGIVLWQQKPSDCLVAADPIPGILRSVAVRDGGSGGGRAVPVYADAPALLPCHLCTGSRRGICGSLPAKSR